MDLVDEILDQFADVKNVPKIDSNPVLIETKEEESIRRFPEAMKLCRKCDKILPVSEFHQNGCDRLSSICKNCARDYRQSKRKIRKEEIKEKLKRDIDGTKTCSLCKLSLPSSDFFLNKKRCKNCVKKRRNVYCIHDKRKTRCKICGGQELCLSPHCEIMPHDKTKNKGYCSWCFRHLFPNESISCAWKTKELSVKNHIATEFPHLDWKFDKIVEGTCSYRRPDSLVDLGDRVIIVETDEHQHTDYNQDCETRRMIEIWNSVQHRPTVFIRFNPDEYIDDKGMRQLSCWNSGKLVKKRKNEWEERLQTLKREIQKWIDEIPPKSIHPVYLFYDANKIITTTRKRKREEE
jgi:hypothetical protein